MCGRYGLYDISDLDILKENTGYAFKPNYNAAPTQTMPVITAPKKAEPMVWGIRRNIGPDIEKDIINTRADKALGRFWAKTVKHNRCLIPANGFYEWRKEGGRKIPYWIHVADRPLFMFAGIFDEDKDCKKHYSIMTTEPNKEMKTIHDRMPVILQPIQEKLWLDPAAQDDSLLQDLLKPAPDNSLEIYEVSPAVNIARNNYGELILPLNSA